MMKVVTGFPRPELLAPLDIGQINATRFCVEPITDSRIARFADTTVRSIVHLWVVSEIGQPLTQKDLDRAAVTPKELECLCRLRVDAMREKYLQSLTIARFLSDNCFIDVEGVVRVSFVLCDPEVQIPSALIPSR